MFDLGIQELIVIFIVALLVFGPKRLPELGKSLGKGLAELKKAMQGVKEQMDVELHDTKQPAAHAEDNDKANNDREGKTAGLTDTHEPAKDDAEDPGKTSS